METVYYLWLNLKEKISKSTKFELLEHFGSAEKLFKADKDAYNECRILSGGDIEALCDKSLKEAEKELKKAQSMGVSLVTADSPEYPKELLNMPDPPVLLYAVGDTSLLNEKLPFCIVGTRHASGYGLSAAMQIAGQIAECGMTVISGCALGIDSAAHKGALLPHGKTIGVAGCGINVDYPSGNEALRREMREKGLIISEFPLDTPPYGHNFPIRNRLLAGLSLGVAVIEAGQRSGALNTAHHAWEQNKDVFALPGNITNKQSGGTNSLIADGASVLLGGDTIIGEYIMRYPKLFEIDEVIKDKNEPVLEDTRKVAGIFETDAADNESKALKILAEADAHIDDISREIGISAAEANVLMTMLQIKGKVLEKPGRIYTLK
ncbi:MAG: DNA-processing protein DprA [Clostridia bacterium]|nr:DNA-processing protein DprA [Clostridia bacterium]